MAPLFPSVLPEEVREALSVLFKPRKARRGRVLFYPDDPAEEVFFIEEGWVRLFELGPREEEVTLVVVGKGELFGEAALAEGRSYGVFAEPMGSVRLLAAPGLEVVALADRHPEVYAFLVRLLTERLWNAEARLREIRYKEVRPRLVRTLLAMMREGERGLEVALSHQDLAHLAGSTRETVTKILGELAMEDLIELGYRRVLIRDPKALASLLE